MVKTKNKIKQKLYWDPVKKFNYPINNISINNHIDFNIDFYKINFIKQIGLGSHSIVYLGEINNKKIVVKIIKHTFSNDKISNCEFRCELCYLARLNHDNIIKLYGYGNTPTKFIVTEYLENGTIQDYIFKESLKQNTIFYKIYKKIYKNKSNIENLLNTFNIGLQIARGMKYLHFDADKNSSFIHRDLKPENIGFDIDKKLKIFDFGLCTLIYKKRFDNETFKMSGDTGSIRYMAPEVYLKNNYNESCDVYSFGIILWQITTKKIPFQGFTRYEFEKKVVYNNFRPKLNKKWGYSFSALLENCWNEDYRKRPTFNYIENILLKLKDIYTDLINKY